MRAAEAETNLADLFIAIGSSLVVFPGRRISTSCGP